MAVKKTAMHSADMLCFDLRLNVKIPITDVCEVETILNHPYKCFAAILLHSMFQLCHVYAICVKIQSLCTQSIIINQIIHNAGVQFRSLTTS